MGLDHFYRSPTSWQQLVAEMPEDSLSLSDNVISYTALGDGFKALFCILLIFWAHTI